MSPRQTTARLVGLLGVLLSCAAGSAQTSGTAGPVVSEARRREVLQAADALTSETLAEVLRRAEAGDVEAQVLAGIAFVDGKGAPKDVNRAIRWLQPAAEKSHPIAQNMLGNLCNDGAGLPRDPVAAVEWYTKAAAQGYAQAQSNLGWAHFDGRGVPANPVEAIRLFRLAAEQGNENGQTSLGYAFAVGKGVEKNPREAAGWYRKAAEQGNATAQLHLALAYISGEGVRKDKAEAETWLGRSSRQGNAIGSFQLALLNLEKPGPGRLDPLSTGVAIEKFELTAEQGYSLGAFALGEMFAGRLAKYHVNEDRLVACTWYTVASRLAGQGEWERLQPEQVAAMRKDLPGRIDKIRKRLAPSQQAACEDGASHWLAEHSLRRRD